jgi:hypothetical protein
MATQSIDAMLEHYPQDRLNALTNEFHSLAFLSANSPTSLKWMADRIGNTDSRLPHTDKARPYNTPGDWASTLDPTQFHTLPHGRTIGPDCIPGIFLNTHQFGVWYSEEGVKLPPSLPSSSAHVSIPAHWHELRPWDDEDLKRLNLVHLKDDLNSDGPASPSGRPPRPSRPSPGTHFPRFRP